MRIPHFSGDVYLCRLKKTDIIMITTSRFFKEKQYMWYKVRELQSKGLNKTQEAPGSGQKHRAEISADVPGRFCKEAEFASQIHAETGRIRGVCAGDSGGISVHIGRTDA